MTWCYVTADGTRYPLDATRFRGDDGQLLDLAGPQATFPWGEIRRRTDGLWRYREALPFDGDGWRAVSMGEGLTPVVSFGPEHPRLYCKLDYLMPTLSFKDRGAAVLIAKARELGASACVADSSGNAGTAVAAYAARAGMACEVFVPAATSPRKLAQIAAHGATVRAIAGSREDVVQAALEAVEGSGAFYASHVYNPLFYEGTKTYVFEVFEQFEGVPEVLVLPVGNGTLALGCWKGLCELRAAGHIDRLPRLVLVQAANCSPLAQAWARGETRVSPVATAATRAEGIAIASPRRGEQVLAAVRATGGTIVAVSEAEIESAQAELARRGLFVEVTSAASYAGYLRWRAAEPNAAERLAVLPLCGAGLKSA